MGDMRLHRPVLLQESVELLNCKSGGFYVDCTAGMGGHSERILEFSSPDGELLAIDRDEEAIRFIQPRLAAYKHRVTFVQTDYRMLKTVLQEYKLREPSGILADFGISLLQLTSPDRGFSFQTEGPLDMRMDRSQEQTAEEIVNRLGVSDLARILRTFGEEQAALRIAKKIVEERKRGPITTTEQLRRIVETVKPRKREEKIHPATKTFQALRIAVNSELEGLDSFLFDAFDSLIDGGRLVIIAFHSLEDRIVKRVFQFLSAACRCGKRRSQCICGGEPLSRMLTKKPITPSDEEIAENPMSRSAKLRTIEKIKGPIERGFWTEWLDERD